MVLTEYAETKTLPKTNRHARHALFDKKRSPNSDFQ